MDNIKPVERELKLNNPHGAAKEEEVLAVLKKYFSIGSCKAKVNIDTYYDTENGELLQSDDSLRIRDSIKDGKPQPRKGTLKMRTSEEELYSSRVEIEEKAGDIDEFLETLKSYELPEECADRLGRIDREPAIIITTDRDEYLLTSNEGALFKICFDSSLYKRMTGEEVRGDMIEVEYEEKDNAPGDVQTIKDTLEIIFTVLTEEFDGLSVDNRSKYFLGMHLTEIEARHADEIEA